MPSSLSLCTMNHRIQERNNRTNWMQKYIRNLRAKHVHLSSYDFLLFYVPSHLIFSSFLPLLSINNLWIRSVDESRDGETIEYCQRSDIKISVRKDKRTDVSRPERGIERAIVKIANAQSAFLATIVFLRLPCTSAALPYSLYLAPSSQ